MRAINGLPYAVVRNIHVGLAINPKSNSHPVEHTQGLQKVTLTKLWISNATLAKVTQVGVGEVDEDIDVGEEYAIVSN